MKNNQNQQYLNHPLFSKIDDSWRKKIEKAFFNSAIFIFSIFMIVFGIWIFTQFIPKYNGNQLIKTLFYDPFVKGERMKEVFFIFASFLLGSLAVLICFRVGIINLGISGQMAFSGLTIYFVAFYLKKIFPHLFQDDQHLFNILWMMLFFVIGIIASVFVSLFCGFIKLNFRVNEILSTIMVNYIIFYVYRYFVTLNGITNGTLQATKVPIGKTMEFNVTFSIFSISLIISLLIFFFWCFVLKTTQFGFSLKLMGINKKATRYSGINEKRTIMIVFFLSGILAGIAGIFYYYRDLNYTNLSSEDALPSNGFDTVTIVWLSRSSFFALPFASFLIALIRTQQKVILISTIDPVVVEIIIGLLILGITFFSNKLFTKETWLFLREKFFLTKEYLKEKNIINQKKG